MTGLSFYHFGGLSGVLSLHEISGCQEHSSTDAVDSILDSTTIGEARLNVLPRPGEALEKIKQFADVSTPSRTTN